MLNIVAEYTLLLITVLMSITTLINFKEFRTGSRLLQISGSLNILSMVLVLLVFIVGTNLLIKITVTVATCIIAAAAIMHGIAINNFHLKHHIVRVLVFLVIIFLVWV